MANRNYQPIQALTPKAGGRYYISDGIGESVVEFTEASGWAITALRVAHSEGAICAPVLFAECDDPVARLSARVGRLAPV